MSSSAPAAPSPPDSKDPPAASQELSQTAEAERAQEAPPQPSRTKSAGNVLANLGKSVVFMHPVYLMGEAVTGRKPGTGVKKSGSELVNSARELAELLTVDAKDVIVIIDEQLKKGGDASQLKERRQDTFSVLQKEGNNALVVVTQNLARAKAMLEKSSPEIKRSVKKNGRDVLVIVDKGLKNPVVITGVTKLAKSRGIPYSEAMIGLATVALGKLLSRLAEEADLEGENNPGQTAEEAGERIQEIDAEEFERQANEMQEKDAEQVTSEAKGEDTTNADKGKNCVVS